MSRTTTAPAAKMLDKSRSGNIAEGEPMSATAIQAVSPLETIVRCLRGAAGGIWRNLLPLSVVAFGVACAGVVIHSHVFERTDGLPLGLPASLRCPRCGGECVQYIEGYQCQGCGH